MIDEAFDRIDLNTSIDNPIEHCIFNLDASIRVLKESKLPSLHKDVQKDAKHAIDKLKQVQKDAEKALGKKKADVKKLAKVEADLDKVHASIFAMRDSIATQQLAP
ncbi:hypothetical protein D3C83_55930 [compost metagenome]